MIKKITILTVLLGLVVWVSPTTAAKPNFTPEIPEVSGVYDVPGNPGMKVRVFVHNVKSAKPGPTSNLICTGITDDNSNAVVDSAGWKVPSTPWNYFVNQTAPSSISGEVSAIVDRSFDTWMSIAKLASAVNLQYGGTTSANRAVYDGQNIIAWGRASGSALGVTYIWYQNGIAIELDTIMNNKFTWDWADQTNNNLCAYSNVYDAQNILTHELGHWFGLDDHYTSDYLNNTMYGYGSKMEIKKDTLTTGDINGINAIY